MLEIKGLLPLRQVEQKQQPSQQQAEETLYAEPILVNQSKPNPLGRIYSPIGKLWVSLLSFFLHFSKIYESFLF
jgi:hypothetical protein